MDWTSYHPVADMQEYMAYLVETYSDLVSIVSIGKSYEGNDMQVGTYLPLTPNIMYLVVCGTLIDGLCISQVPDQTCCIGPDLYPVMYRFKLFQIERLNRQ